MRFMKILQTVAGEKLGFRYGKPLRIDEGLLSVVVPILRETSISRLYTTFPETDKVRVFDTGRIDVMEAENTGPDNVFIRSGTLFRGATQERALRRSVMLFPGMKVSLSVRGVHASRPINPNARTGYGGLTPLAFDQRVYSSGYTPKSQSDYWTTALHTAQKFCEMTGKGQGASTPSHGEPILSSLARASGSTISSTSQHTGSVKTKVGGAGMDDLASHSESFSRHFDEILSKAELQKNQAGLALLTQNAVETIEFFDHPLSCRRCMNRLSNGSAASSWPRTRRPCSVTGRKRR
jgi:hypothetical protein